MTLGRNGFDKGVRLCSAGDYRHVFQRPVRRKNRLLSLLVRRNRVGQARLGLAVSKKSLPRAVDRNRVKRLVRETFRTERANLDPVDMVVMAQRWTGRVENGELRRALHELWIAAKVWAGTPKPPATQGN